MRILFALSVVALAACQQAAPVPDASPVIAAERAFAADAAQRGWVEAFEAHSSEEAILLAARPENAHRSLAAIHPANRGDTSLSWGPEFAGISRGGDFGFTTGPYNGGGEAFGQYFTVWRRQPDGAWKWIYDGGVNQTTPTNVNASAVVDVTPVGARGAGSAEAAIAAVLRREMEFAEAAARGVRAAVAAAMAETGRMNRENQPTAVGRAAAVSLAGEAPVRYAPPQLIEASANGDMAFTLGEARWDGGSGYYQRIWLLQADGWKVAYDQILLRPLDAARAEPAAP